MQRLPQEVWAFVFSEIFRAFHFPPTPPTVEHVQAVVWGAVARRVPAMLPPEESGSVDLVWLKARVERLVKSMYVFFQSEGGL